MHCTFCLKCGKVGLWFNFSQMMSNLCQLSMELLGDKLHFERLWERKIQELSQNHVLEHNIFG